MSSLDPRHLAIGPSIEEPPAGVPRELWAASVAGRCVMALVESEGPSPELGLIAVLPQPLVSHLARGPMRAWCVHEADRGESRARLVIAFGERPAPAVRTPVLDLDLTEGFERALARRLAGQPRMRACWIDADELVVVRRDELRLTDEQRRRIAAEADDAERRWPSAGSAEAGTSRRPGAYR